MSALAWITLAVGLPPWVTLVVVAIGKLTRLVDAVESLAKLMGKVVAQVVDHEQRLTKGGL